MIGTVAPFSMSSPSPVSGDDYQFDVPDLSHQEIQELAEDKITSLVDGGSMSPAEAEIISGNIDNVIKSSSGSNPMIFVLLSMLDMALKTQSQVKVFNIDLANVKKDKAYEGAKELIVNAAWAFGLTVVSAGASLMIGFKAGQYLANAEKKQGLSADPDTTSWAPMATNMTFQVLSAGVDVVKASGQATQQINQADIERIEQVMKQLGQTDEQQGSTISRMNQAQ